MSRPKLPPGVRNSRSLIVESMAQAVKRPATTISGYISLSRDQREEDIDRIEAEKAARKALNPLAIHASEPLPNPYPHYPQMVERFVCPTEACPTVLSILSRCRQAGAQFAATLHVFSYEKYCQGEQFSLTWVVRHATGFALLNPKYEDTQIQTLEDQFINQILEKSLQQRDFQAIRAILNFEGYRVPIKEPNDLVIPEGWSVDKLEEETIEIEMTAEEFEMWQEIQVHPPEEITEPKPFLKTAEYTSFVEEMAKTIPLQLEHAIRKRDIPMLRVLLRLYGQHGISPNQPNDQKDLSELESSHYTNEPPSLDC